ncbi:MAG: hypothetical protein BWY82_00304 [Verrucomicrobia bacterium ADurb.Bin474]|nr:MAG: hypothetical protein BWY82_00304 [Verrucomicrobia bacterium ADurb.Bin474]
MQPGHIRAKPQVVGQQMDGLARSGWKGSILTSRPLGKTVAPPLHPYAIAEVITQHHVKAGQQHLADVGIERADPQAILRAGNENAVAHIPVQDELGTRPGLIQIGDFTRPCGQHTGHSGRTHACAW